MRSAVIFVALFVVQEDLIREIKEELDTTVEIERYLDTVEYDYPEFHLSMDCFLCSISFR